MSSSSVIYVQQLLYIKRASCISPVASLKNCSSHRFCGCGSSNLPSPAFPLLLIVPYTLQAAGFAQNTAARIPSRKKRSYSCIQQRGEGGVGRQLLPRDELSPLIRMTGHIRGPFCSPRSLNRRRSRPARAIPRSGRPSLFLPLPSSFLLFPAIRCIVIDWPPVYVCVYAVFAKCVCVCGS